MSHNDFRRRLAWTFLTLGKEEFLDDIEAGASAGSSPENLVWTPSIVGSASHLYTGPHEHMFVIFTGRKKECHTCGYCGKLTSKFCYYCEQSGRRVIAVCGRKSKRDCIDRNQRGDAV